MTKEFTMPMPVPHGAPIEHDVCTEWCEVGRFKANFKLYWSTVHPDGSQYSDRLEHQCLTARTKDNTSH